GMVVECRVQRARIGCLPGMRDLSWPGADADGWRALLSRRARRGGASAAECRNRPRARAGSRSLRQIDFGSKVGQSMVRLFVCGFVTAFALAAATAPERCTEMLMKALQDGNPDTRKEAVIALSLAADDGRLFAQLEKMLGDRDVQVRE